MTSCELLKVTILDLGKSHHTQKVLKSDNESCLTRTTSCNERTTPSLWSTKEWYKRRRTRVPIWCTGSGRPSLLTGAPTQVGYLTRPHCTRWKSRRGNVEGYEVEETRNVDQPYFYWGSRWDFRTFGGQYLSSRRQSGPRVCWCTSSVTPPDTLHGSWQCTCSLFEIP